MILGERLIHDLNCYTHFFISVIITTYILRFPFLDQVLFNHDQTEDTDKHSNSIVKDVRCKIPQAFIWTSISVGKSDGNGKIDEMSKHLRKPLLGCIE